MGGIWLFVQDDRISEAWRGFNVDKILLFVQDWRLKDPQTQRFVEKINCLSEWPVALSPLEGSLGV